LKNFPPGIYDLLHTTQLHDRLENAGLLDSAVWSSIEPEDLKHYLAIPLVREIAGFISEAISGKKGDDLTKALEESFKTPEALNTIL
jgi:hypothetical protein